MQTVHLVGGISKFGEKWETSCRTIPDIFKLIDCQTPGFRQYMIDAADKGIEFQIARGEDFIDENELLLSLGKEDIFITEVPAGQKGGSGKILAAVAIVALVAATGGFGGAGIFGGGGIQTVAGSTIGQAGTSVQVATGLGTLGQVAVGVAINLALSGISQLMAPGPETDGSENESYLFNGPVNTVQQGVPVPVAYGELIVGGATISTSFSTQRFGYNPYGNYGPTWVGTGGVAPSGVDSSPSSSGGSPEGDCFIADALVTMADGSTKRIQDVVEGDLVKGNTGDNSVLEVKIIRGPFYLFSINNSDHFVTSSHPFLTTDGWKSFNKYVSRQLHPDLNIEQLEIGDTLVTQNGNVTLESFSSISQVLPVFNLNVDGDDTYIVNDFIVHNK
jgi:predicted phage tail protein